jgi:hypothetical protein
MNREGAKSYLQNNIQWFCEAIEFLGHEYRAREQVAAEILGRKLAKNLSRRL